ncbi:AAA family ATPase [Nocardia sp. CA-107356]|uniref:AAA family ATPase n=1 Tax=Nocardia sp. CA-107356 TaxID=3239972 RepID=UPI003D89BD30
MSGPPGAGKSTLAHALAARVGIPAIIRDEIKQGMVAATVPTSDGLLRRADRARPRWCQRGRRSRVPELWRPNLLRVAEFAEIRINYCTAPQHMFHDRITHRAEHDLHRRAHNDADLLAEIAAGTRTAESFVPVKMDVAQMTVDTTNGYEPGFDAIARFVTTPDQQL